MFLFDMNIPTCTLSCTYINCKHIFDASCFFHRLVSQCKVNIYTGGMHSNALGTTLGNSPLVMLQKNCCLAGNLHFKVRNKTSSVCWFFKLTKYPTNIYLFKVNSRNTRNTVNGVVHISSCFRVSTFDGLFPEKGFSKCSLVTHPCHACTFY